METDLIQMAMQRSGGVMFVVTGEELRKYADASYDRGRHEAIREMEERAQQTWLLPVEAEIKYGKSKSTLARWAARGKIKAKHVGQSVFYLEADLLAVIAGKK